MKKHQIIILFILNLLLDLVILSRYQIFGFIPSVTIPIIIALSMFSTKESIVYYAIFQGFIQDLTFANTIGLNALMLYLISYYMFKLNKNNNNNLIYAYLTILISLVFTKIYRLITGYIFINRNISINISEAFRGFVFELVFMIIVFTLIHIFISNIQKRQKRKLI